MEISQAELLEQLKISAVKAEIFESRLDKVIAMYSALYNRITEELDKPNTTDDIMNFDFIDTFPAKIEF